MKRINIIYWIVTILTAAGFLMSSVLYLSANEEIVSGFAYMKLPAYLIPFLGIAKGAGAIGILQTVSKGAKEWAYAGMTFNLLGAIYAHYALDTPVTAPLLFLLLVAASYLLYHRRTAQLRSASYYHGNATAVVS